MALKERIRRWLFLNLYPLDPGQVYVFLYDDQGFTTAAMMQFQHALEKHGVHSLALRTSGSRLVAVPIVRGDLIRLLEWVDRPQTGLVLEKPTP